MLSQGKQTQFLIKHKTIFGPREGPSVSVLATLPNPGVFGNYNIYVATVFLKDIGGFGNQMFATPQDPPTWAVRIDFPTVVSLTPNAEVVVAPSNSVTGIQGPLLLRGTFASCDICGLNLFQQYLNKVSGSVRVDQGSGDFLQRFDEMSMTSNLKLITQTSQLNSNS